MYRKFLLAALIISSQLTAQDSAYKELGQVIYTAHKYPKKQSETGKVVHVISSLELSRSQGKTLPEILNTIAGVTVPGSQNALGTILTLNIRGSSAGNVLVLIDGIPLNDPSVNNNYLDLNFIATSQIDRIEILKGGQSTLYGSDAVAGVVNIITRKHISKKIELSSGLAAGSYGTFQQDVGLAGNTGTSGYSLNYSHIGSKGFSSAYDSAGIGGFDRDGFDRHALAMTTRFSLGSAWTARIFGQLQLYDADLDAAAFTDERDYTSNNKNGIIGGGISRSLTGGSISFNYQFNYVSREYLNDSFHISSPYITWSESFFIGRTHFTEIYGSRQWKNFELLAGADYRYHNTLQDYNSRGPFGPYDGQLLWAQMSQISPYVSLVFDTAPFNLEMGGRWNYHSEFGSNFTYNFNPSLQLKPAKLFANLYSAFKAPTLYQLFDPFAGNVDLEPERSIVAEAGIDVTPGKNLESRVTGFYRRSKNTIQYIAVDPVNFISQYRNISSQTNYGVELEFAVLLNKLSLRANYTYTDGETESAYDGTGWPIGKDTTYYNLFRIPRHALNVTAGYQIARRVFVRSGVKVWGERYEFIYGDAPQRMAPYYTVDLYGEYRKEHFTFFADFKNVTDQRYFDFPGYNARKFNFMVGVNFRF